MLVLILSFLLSLFCGGREGQSGERSGTENPCSLSASPATETPSDYAPSRDLCVTAAQGWSFAGGDSSNSVSVRNTQTGRRITPQTKSTVRVVKGGKIVDNNHIHPFLSPDFVRLSGTHTSERYLFSICRLRI